MNKLIKLRIILLIIFLGINSALINSQDGSPFLTNFYVPDQSLKENYSICQDKDGALLLANRKGILLFDAEEWKLIKTPELPLVVQPDPSKTLIFVGCRNNIGYISKNQLGDYEYFSIAGAEAGTVTQIAFVGSDVFFLSQTALTRVNISEVKELFTLKCKAGKSFSYLLVQNDKVFVDVAGEGLNELNNNVLKPLSTPFALSGKIVFAVNYDKTSLLMGTSDNKCYLYDFKTIRPYTLEDQQYITDGNLVDGKLLNDNKIVLATSAAGCLIIDKNTGKTLFTVNIQNGLPDDEILALNTDVNQGIWVAHFSGLTRIDATIPVRNFTAYKGLNGKPQTTENVNGKLYIGTTNGLYFLDKKKDYVEYSVKKETAPLPVVVPVKTEQVTSKIEESKPQEPRKGLLARLFSRKQKTEETPKIESSEPKPQEEKKGTGILGFFGLNKPETNNTPVVQKVYKLASVTHMYTKITGFDHKCKQLINANGQLIAITVNGVYLVTDSRCTEIVPNIQINYAYYVAEDKTVYLCTDKGIMTLQNNGLGWKTGSFNLPLSEPAYSFTKDMFENYWIGLENKAIKVKFKRDGEIKEQKIYRFNSEQREPVKVRLSNKKPLFLLASGIYSIFNDSIQLYNPFLKYTEKGVTYFYSQQNNTWIHSGNNWIALSATGEPDSISANYLNLFDNVSAVFADGTNTNWVIDDYSTVYKIDQKAIAQYRSNFNAYIKRFSGSMGEVFSLSGVELDQHTNVLYVHASAPYYIKPKSNQFQYKIVGLMNNWSDWTSNPEFMATLGSGNWEIAVRAKNIFGTISEEQILPFKIKKPFYQTWWFILLCIIALGYLVFLFIKFRERKLQRENEILEEKVRERTRQIEEQKEEIEAQRDQIFDQNREITDSIRYAKRLQTAVMPDMGEISKLLSDYFILFRPKDIVSGDFYWVKTKNDKVIVAAADCTGHGVPGGFLSMLGMSLLNEISALNRDFRANEILNILKSHVIGTLSKEGQDETKDGMDISLCIFDFKHNKLEYAGANNSIYLIRNNELIEHNPDKMPIGSYVAAKESFTNNEIDLQKNDTIYMFSDGYRDQLGGPNEKRIKSPGFRKLLLENTNLPMRKQKETLEQFFDDWRGPHEQVDDIMVLGIKI